jgi:8-oxo-dGTP diphosphatase
MSVVCCPSCGTPYPDGLPLDDEGARNCPNCGFANYTQLKVGAAALVEQDGSILLIRRSEEPFMGSWGLPAGYVRWNESPESATIRETEEECGLVVEIQSLMGVYFFDDDPRGNGILITYRCRPVSGTPGTTPEASDVRFFRRGALPSSLAGSGQDQAILAWESQTPP